MARWRLALRHEKPQKGNPHRLTIKQHVHSAACIRRFADEQGRVLVWRREGDRAFFTTPDSDLFAARRAWSHGVEHRVFGPIEVAFQRAVDVALNGGPVDHEAVTNYAVLWSVRDHMNVAGREPIQLSSVKGGELTKDEEEKLESVGVAFVREDGSIPAHIGRHATIRQLLDMNAAALSGVRWRLGRVPVGLALICPDAYGDGSTGVIPINRTSALLATHEPGEPDEMDPELVNRLNTRSMSLARTLVFGHPDDLEAVVSRAWPRTRTGPDE